MYFLSDFSLISENKKLSKKWHNNPSGSRVSRGLEVGTLAGAGLTGLALIKNRKSLMSMPKINAIDAGVTKLASNLGKGAVTGGVIGGADALLNKNKKKVVNTPFTKTRKKSGMQ